MADGTAGHASGDPSPPAAGAHTTSARPQLAAAARAWAPLLGLWAVVAIALSLLTTRVVNWYLMTDELFYERLAISVIQERSLLPRIHGELLPNVNQLYPVLLAPAFRHELILDALRDAHVINAFLITSTCIPAFLLARRVTGRLWASYLTALLTITVPWIVYSGFLLTEVAGYPAFAWAVYLIHRATASPSRGNDWLALGGIALATSARVQFVALLAVPPVAILAHSLAFSRGGWVRPRAGAAVRDALRPHRTLTVAYAILAAGALALLAAGQLSTALGTYKTTATGDILQDGLLRAIVEHSATLALGLGILPFLVGIAWLLSTLVHCESPEAHVFACVALTSIVVTLVEVCLFDLRYGGESWIADRYLYYVAPLVFVAFAGALCGTRWPRWSILVPAAVVAGGFWIGDLPTSYYLNLDVVTAVLYEQAISWAGSYESGRWLLILATVALAVLFLQGSVLLRHDRLAVALAAVTLATMAAGTAAALDRMVRPNAETGRRELLRDQNELHSWIDRFSPRVGADVTMIPYPYRAGEYWTNVGEWWTLEFWNKAIVRSAHYPGEYEWTPSTFAKTYLRFDPETGRANASPTGFVAQSDKDARFRIAGEVVALPREVMLIDAERPWRTDWLSFGLTPDGWTKPGVEARVRVYPFPGQEGPLTRLLYVSVEAPSDVARRPFRAESSLDEWSGVAIGQQRTGRLVATCVPEDGYGEVRISTPVHSPVYGDQRDGSTLDIAREAGILVRQLALADENAGPCDPEAPAG